MVVYKVISTARPPLATALSIIVQEDKDHAMLTLDCC
jgi:hypothetical protein